MGGMDGQPDASATVTATSGTPTITIQNFAFHPSTLIVSKGMTVKFVQADTTPHDVAGSAASAFIHSPVLHKGQSYTVTFSKTGTFNYICAIHPDMHGKVIVR